MSDIKPKRAAYDFRMTLHYGLALGEADALFGVRVQNKLCWPPAQVKEKDVVEAFPYSKNGAGFAYQRTEYEALNEGRGAVAAFGANHAQIMTSARSDIVEQEDLFGGDDGAGGVHGLIDWMPGASDQIPPEHVDTKSGFAVGEGPGHRGYSSVFFSGARKRSVLRDSIGGIINIVGSAVSLMSSGFLWSTNDPRQPAASFRVMRIPRAKPLSDWVAGMGASRPTHQLGVLAVYGPGDTPRLNDDDKELKEGGGFPRANPAAFLYEIIATNGYDSEADDAKMDGESFLIAARIFSIEGLGISVKSEADDGFEDLVTQICDHVGAVVFLHPKTGLYTIRVLRPDSAFAALNSESPVARPEKSGFVLTPSNASISSEILSRSPAELASSLEVTYTIDETEETAIVTLVSQRAIIASGGNNAAQKSFPFFRDRHAATTAGTRELAVMSTPAITFQADLTREAWYVAPFDVVTVNWPSEPAIHGRRFRVAEIDYGTNGDRVITASFIEDVFHNADKSFAQVAAVEQRSRFSSPISSSPTLGGIYVTPPPAPLLIGSGVTIDDLNDMADDGVTRSAYLAHSGRQLSGADVMSWLNGQSPPAAGVFIDATPRALTKVDLPAESVSMIDFYGLDFGAQETDIEVGDKLIFVRAVSQDASESPHFINVAPASLTARPAPIRYTRNTSVSSLPWAVGSAAMALDAESDIAVSGSGRGLAPYFREEIAQVTAIDRETGIATIRRGVFDTVPAMIPAGSAVFHFADAREVPSVGNEISGSTYRTSATAKSPSGVGRERVSIASHAASPRFNCPARPGNTRLTANGETVTFGQKMVLDEPANITVSWAPRNRLMDDAEPRAWTDGPITAEVGSKYYVRLWRRVRARTPFTEKYPAPANMVRAWYNLTGTSFVIPEGEITADILDPTAMSPQTGAAVPSDIVSGASYAIEIGTHRGDITETVAAPASIQNALMLLDVGVSSGGYGLAYGQNYGGAVTGEDDPEDG